jgi:sirohydrochlorin ferrochelatase
MQIKVNIAALILLAGLAGLAGAGQTWAQSATIDVTLEVLDDVSEIDAVVLRLEDAREADEDRTRRVDEERERDEFDRSVRDAETERETRDREVETDRDERRELQNEEEDLEAEFERDRLNRPNPPVPAI